jgi:hypothetical protein
MATFEAAYGRGHPVAGVFANGSRLDNAGERIKLEDASSSTIFDFTYGTAFPWPSEGIVVAAPAATGSAPSDPERWRLPVTPAGSPGTSDAVVFQGGDASAFLAYATGGHPEVQLLREETDSGPVWSLAFSRSLAADHAGGNPEVSSDLTLWSRDGLIRLGEERNPSHPGLSTVRYRVPTGPNRQHVRVRWTHR